MARKRGHSTTPEAEQITSTASPRRKRIRATPNYIPNNGGVVETSNRRSTRSRRTVAPPSSALPDNSETLDGAEQKTLSLQISDAESGYEDAPSKKPAKKGARKPKQLSPVVYNIPDVPTKTTTFHGKQTNGIGLLQTQGG